MIPTVAGAIVGVICLAVVVAGVLAPIPRVGCRHQLETKPEPEPEPQAVCQCEHGLAFHDGDEGGCLFSSSEQVLMSRSQPRVIMSGPLLDPVNKVIYREEKYETRTERCACQHYVGPMYLPRYLP